MGEVKSPPYLSDSRHTRHRQHHDQAPARPRSRHSGLRQALRGVRRPRAVHHHLQGPWVAEGAADIWDPKGIADNLPSPTSLLGRLGNWWTWDRQAVKGGIFKNDNIMIHVGQNLFNFVFTTLAWFTVSQIYSLTAAVNPATPREMRSITLEQAAEEVLDAITAFEHKQKQE